MIDISKIPSEDLPFIFIVLPTTHARIKRLPLALDCWARQDYPKSRYRVLVLDGGDGSEYVAGNAVEDLVKASRKWFPWNFDYDFLRGEAKLGEKFNAGFDQAPEGSLTLSAGDDDWVSPRMLSTLVALKLETGADIVGGVSMLAFRERDQKAFLYASPYAIEIADDGPEAGTCVYHATDPYLIGALTLVPRAMWAELRLPPFQKASDSHFIRELLANGTPIDEVIKVEAQYGENFAFCRTLRDGRDPLTFVQLHDPSLYVASVHGNNTGNALDSLDRDDHPVWSPIDYDLRGVMGDADGDRFGLPPRKETT